MPIKGSNLGELLRLCRERSGMSQEDLARKLYVDRTVISKIETGSMLNPSYTVVKQWAQATDSVDLISLDFSGSDGWKKLKALEEKVSKIKELVNFMKVGRRKQRVSSTAARR